MAAVLKTARAVAPSSWVRIPHPPLHRTRPLRSAATLAGEAFDCPRAGHTRPHRASRSLVGRGRIRPGGPCPRSRTPYSEAALKPRPAFRHDEQRGRPGSSKAEAEQSAIITVSEPLSQYVRGGVKPTSFGFGEVIGVDGHQILEAFPLSSLGCQVEGRGNLAFVNAFEQVAVVDEEVRTPAGAVSDHRYGEVEAEDHHTADAGARVCLDFGFDAETVGAGVEAQVRVATGTVKLLGELREQDGRFVDCGCPFIEVGVHRLL